MFDGQHSPDHGGGLPPVGKPGGEGVRLGGGRRGWLAAGVATIVAIAVVAQGIVSRNHAAASLAEWTTRQAIPKVATVLPASGSIETTLILPGNIEAFHEAPIYARVDGYLKGWNTDIGTHVPAGEVLATIDTPELDQKISRARAELANAEADSSLADVTAVRWHALLLSNSVSHQSADEKSADALAKQAEVSSKKAYLERLLALQKFRNLVSPFAGIVTARHTDVGALISSGSTAREPLFEVADVHEMRIYVRVPQAYANYLTAGMGATFTDPNTPENVLPAEVATLSQAVSLSGREFLVELLAPNPDQKLWTNSSTQVMFKFLKDEKLRRVPATALLFRDGSPCLAVVGPDKRVVLKQVTLGPNLDQQIEIKAGISDTDRVVTAPPDTLQQGDLVAPQ